MSIDTPHTCSNIDGTSIQLICENNNAIYCSNLKYYLHVLIKTYLYLRLLDQKFGPYARICNIKTIQFSIERKTCHIAIITPAKVFNTVYSRYNLNIQQKSNNNVPYKQGDSCFFVPDEDPFCTLQKKCENARNKINKYNTIAVHRHFQSSQFYPV